ncbi:MAG: epoxyqueuosine reductase QueH [Clostridia bacterium]|nr:epoxyqueuosine reductase QueH [Clostridia bacterium]
MKVNYQIALERELQRIADSGRRPRLLLHSCCAPCSSYVLEYLNRAFDIAVYYYNPNIAPAEEFEHRVAEQIRLAEALPHAGHIEVIRGEYDPRAFYDAVRGHEDDPEGGARCERCFRLRLAQTARLAAERGDDYFTTTLTISPLKDAQLINLIGMELSKDAGVPWLPCDFKKKNGYKRSCELSEIYGLYRQDYCGCVFSRRRDYKGHNK